MALHEWGLTPEYINRNWTEELLALMFISRARRSKRQSEAAADAAEGKQGNPQYKMVPEEELFKEIGFTPEVVHSARN